MGYKHINSRGQTYWLHKRVGRGGATLFFFSKSEEDSTDLPEGNWEVRENTKTGLPLLARK